MTHNYTPIIGLEIHIELATKSKMFCRCSADHFGKKPNTLTCPVCLGLPGALPVPNKKAIDWTIMLGLALNCKVAGESKFDRKNYFYPDLPKGYQISQYDQPLATQGSLKLQAPSTKSQTNPNNQIQDNKQIQITRVHLEEDTGKLVHGEVGGEKVTLVDFNRSGVPLVEIVTEPDLRSSGEAVIFMKKLRQIVRYLGISSADMEKGSMRIEPNISVMRNVERVMGKTLKERKNTSHITHHTLPSYKVEIKNINSFRFAKKSIDYEIKRQTELLVSGKIPKQETRGWDEKKNKTTGQRSKEEAHDYRYFPEPDIPPLVFKDTDITRLKADLTEMPDIKAKRFIREHGLSEYYAEILTATNGLADYFEETVKYGKKQNIDTKRIANWIVNKKPDPNKISPQQLIAKISKESNKRVMPYAELDKIVKKVLIENNGAIEDYKKGKQAALGFLVGQVMQETKGQANAKQVQKLTIKEIKND
jgi:aspartyl-tRNA(Asn)/glutamyl-tRNA(Gln) amidotransferase subunit B